MEKVLHILDQDGRIVQYLLEAGHWIYLGKKKFTLEFDICLIAGSIPALTANTEWHSANTTLSPEQFTQQLAVLSIRAESFLF